MAKSTKNRRLFILPYVFGISGACKYDLLLYDNTLNGGAAIDLEWFHRPDQCFIGIRWKAETRYGIPRPTRRRVVTLGLGAFHLELLWITKIKDAWADVYDIEGLSYNARYNRAKGKRER